MRRFNYEDNEDYREDVDKFFAESMGNQNFGDLTDEEYKMMMENESIFEDMQVQIVYRDLNHRILRAAVRVCEKSFWWRFLSIDTRLKHIDATYKHLKKLEEEEEEED